MFFLFVEAKSIEIAHYAMRQLHLALAWASQMPVFHLLEGSEL